MSRVAVVEERRSRPFLRRWLACSVSGAVVMSIVDGALLQRRESYFTGGFLSRDHLAGSGDIALFIATSFLADLAVIGVIAAVVMWLLPALRPRASAVAGVMSGLVILLAADIVAYQLVLYLGDAIDVALMFELTGNSIAELLAVSGSYLVTPVVVVAGGLALCTGVVHVVNRRDSAEPVGRPPFRAIGAPAVLMVTSLLTTTTAVAFNDSLENGLTRKPAGKVLTFIADTATDVDRDGFGLTGRLSDPDPVDALVYPYAVDVPGNGIDEDGIGGDLPASAVRYVESSPVTRWTRHPDVVMVVLESFRFDLLHARFDGRPITPVLNALGARGLSSDHAYSHNGYTAQSRFHLLTGSLAGIRGNTSLVDDFKANGYFVAYMSAQDESFGGARYEAGFSRADIQYDARSDRQLRYSTFSTAGSLAVPFSVVVERVGETLRSRVPADRPLFLYINLHDTHFPYTHDGVQALISSLRVSRQRIVPAERTGTWATYVNTAANVDHAIGRILDDVRQVRGEEPGVIVTSDHGESLFDDGFLGHGHQLNDVQTQVPLIVANLPVVVDEPFGQIDLRDAVGAAMSADASAGVSPRLSSSASREVFQYLGNVNRPRQIAFNRGDGRFVYDFRSGQAQRRDGTWVDPTQLSSDDAAVLGRLIQFWERMMLARQEAGRG